MLSIKLLSLDCGGFEIGGFQHLVDVGAIHEIAHEPEFFAGDPEQSDGFWQVINLIKTASNQCIAHFGLIKKFVVRRQPHEGNL
jgi:hypothetical protein